MKDSNPDNMFLPENVLYQIFVALQAQKAFSQVASEFIQAKPVMFADILFYVNGSSVIDVNYISKAINSDLNLYRTYQRLLAKTRVVFASREAYAKSSETIKLRICNDFVIKMTASKANPSHIYIILQVKQPMLFSRNKTLVLHVTTEKYQVRLDFPPLKKGQTQILVAIDDVRLMALRDNSELSLL